MKKLSHSNSGLLLLLMAIFVALGPLSTDMYLPALPAMVDSFNTQLSAVQLTISSYLLGFALFHLVCGPLSDRYGRKPILIVGLLIFMLSSIGCALAGSIESLIAWRLLQGLGACTGPTIGRAMVRDIYGPTGAAKALAYMAAIMALAPVIAPTFGAWLTTLFNWSAVFWFLCAYSTLGMIIIAFLLPETLPVQQSLRLKVIAANYRQLITHRDYLAYVLASSCLYAGAFAFISGSSFVLIDQMGVPPQQFGLWFMIMVVGYILGSIFTGRYAHSFASAHLMLAGAVLGMAAGLVMTSAILMGFYHPLAIILPVTCYTAAVGITLPQSMGAALAPFPNTAGTASALMGFIQMGFAAMAGALVGWLLKDNPLPMALVITGCGCMAVLLFAMLLLKADVNNANSD